MLVFVKSAFMEGSRKPYDNNLMEKKNVKN